MTKPKTITVRMVQEAYKKTCITPCFEAYCDVIMLCGCPLTALYLNEHPQALSSYKKHKYYFRNKAFPTLVKEWAIKQFKSDYINGFIEGVDNCVYDTCNLNTDEFNRGKKEGSDVRKVLLLKEKKNG